MSRDQGRRRFLRAAGTAAAVAVAGCSGGGDAGTETGDGTSGADPAGDDAGSAGGASGDGESWPTVQADARNTGRRDVTPPDGPVGELWDHETAGGRPGDVVVASGRVFVPEQTLTALDAASGDVAWRHDGLVPAQAPTVVDDTVLVPGGKRLTALDAATGDVRWSSADWEESAPRGPGTPAVADGTAFYSSKLGTVFAVDVETGERRWDQDIGLRGEPNPAVANGVVVAAGEDVVTALAADSGDVEWTFEAGATVTAAPTVVDGVVYAPVGGNGVYAIDAASGEERWRTTLDQGIRRSVAHDGDRLYVSPGKQDEGKLYALDSNDGDVIWSVESEAYGTPVVVDDTLFVGGRKSKALWAYATSDGSERYAYETTGFVGTTPAIADGRVYVSTWDGNVHALAADVDDGPITAEDDLEVEEQVRYPRYDRRNTGSTDNRAPTGDPTVRWRRPLDGAVTATPTVADGRVYVGSHAGTFRAIDAATGTEAWSLEVNGAVEAGAPVVDGVVYVVDEGGYVRALDAATGDVRWKREFYSDEGTLAVGDDVLFVGNDPMLRALDRASGDTRWEREFSQDTTPTFVDDRLYITWDAISELDPETGDSVWGINKPMDQPPVVADDAIYTADARNVYRLDPDGGGVTWRTEKETLNHGPLAFDGDRVYTGGSAGAVRALDAASGEVAWTTRTLDEVESAPTVAGDQVLVGSDDGRLHALDVASGDRRWAFDCEDEIKTGVAVASGLAVFATARGDVYAIAGDG